MFKPSAVYYFSETGSVLFAEDNETEVTIWLGECAELMLTPLGLLNYVNSNYPETQIPDNVRIFIAEIYDVCRCERVGTRVNFFIREERKPCEEEDVPVDYVGTGWALDFICGKQLLYKTADGQLQFLALYTPIVDPATGISYTHIEESYYYLIGSDGYCQQRTGYIKTNSSIKFYANETMSWQNLYLLFLTN